MKKLEGKYVSACGMVRAEEIKATQDLLPDNLRPATLYGVQVSASTLAGGINKRGSNWYPHGPNDLRKLCWQAKDKSLGRVALHLNPKDNGVHIDMFLDLVLGAIARPALNAEGNPAFEYPTDAIQLNNLRWDYDQYAGLVLKLKKLGIAVILQANARLCANDPLTFARALVTQAPDYVLLDSSGGTGYGFDLDTYAGLIDATQKTCEIGIGIAGGLGPEPQDIGNYTWLSDRFGPLSADAETKLRSNYNSAVPSTSKYSPEKAAGYIRTIG